MKLKMHNILIMAILCCSTIIVAKKHPGAIYVNDAYETAALLYAPINFTPEGISKYLKYAYNCPEYSADVLPTHLQHFIEFLMHGKKTNQNRAYFKSVFKLFGNKIKAVPCINAYSFSAMLEQVPPLLVDYFSLSAITSLDGRKDQITDILYASFLSKYDMFKKQTQQFFDNLSQEILDSLHSDLSVMNENGTIIELRHCIIRFFETCISKLIWSPDDKEQIWDSFKKISGQLEQLLDANILDDATDLDDLYWSLIHRFCYFMEIGGKYLPLDFFEKVKLDIATQKLLIFELEEQEAGIESKAECLLRVVTQWQIKKEAESRGILLKRG